MAKQSDILVNGRYYSRRITGVERYATEVTRRLGEWVRIIRPTRELDGLSGHLWEQVDLPRHVDEQSLLWSPANTGPLAIARQIVTIHDCSVLDHPEWFQQGFALWYRFLLRKLARRVRRVITDSEFSRHRIIKMCRLPPERVITIPCGVDTGHFHPRPEEETVRTRTKLGINGEYILMVASINPRKNFLRLFQAWEAVTKGRNDLKLIIAGGKSRNFRDPQLQALPENIKFIGYIEESDLPYLYSGARAYINPSLYEGFGLSILEAMACGTAVIAAASTALPEVVGNAGLLVDPHNPDSIAEGMATLISDDVIRERLIHQGLERASLFSWDRTAKLVYEALIQAQNET